ncbi:hypothetical protein [Janthinobacterium sp. PSPC3-1]|uniref:hypothetical protein n=1 Tax=Janthinobacterium sp. PSPC3-1 TaxID=2804653 RepID=UPI003CF497B8
MFKWEKMGKLFDPKDRNDGNWMHDFAQSPTVLVDDDRVRVYFCSRPAPADGQYVSYMSFIDLERDDLMKIKNVCAAPPMALGSYGTFDEFGVNPLTVIRDGEQVRVYYGGWTRCESVRFNAAIGIAVSDDNGDTFRRLGPGPVLGYSHDEPFLLGSPRVRRYGQQWLMWYVAGKEWRKTDGLPEPIYKIRMATSDNGIDWIKHGRDLIADKLGEHECQACPDVIFRDGLYHMFFSYRDIHNYKSRQGGYRIGYASSSDLLHWERQDDLAGMHVSASGWDAEMVNYPHVFVVDEVTYMIYQGNEMGRAGIGLARLQGPQDWSKQ